MNHAVGDLVSWQDNYKDTVEKSYEQFQIATAAIETSKDVESIENQYEGNMKINKDVKVSLETLKHEGLALNKHLEVFNEMAINAKEAFPTIEEGVEKLTKGFATKVDDSIGAVTKYVEKQHESAQTVIDVLNKSVNNTLQVMQTHDTNNNAIRDSSKQMNDAIKGSFENITLSLTNSFSEAMNNISQIQQKIGENMESTILQIDEAHRQELENFSSITRGTIGLSK